MVIFDGGKGREGKDNVGYNHLFKLIIRCSECNFPKRVALNQVTPLNFFGLHNKVTNLMKIVLNNFYKLPAKNNIHNIYQMLF